MLGALVFFVLPLAMVAFYVRAPERGWRDAGVMAALAWALATALMSESLSLVGALRFWPVLIGWLALNGLALVWARRAWRSGVRLPRWEVRAGFERATVLAFAGLFGLALVVAFVAPPNTPDVLSYHLPRQVMWLNRGACAIL